jgi:hypothetical protein
VTQAISNLIRLHAWRIDEHRRAVAAASRQIEDASAALLALEEAFRREQDGVRMAEDCLFGLGAYAEYVRGQRRDLRAALASAEDDLIEARRQLADAYRESRKFELLKAELDRAAAAAAARREQARLDEAAANMRRMAAVR